MPSNASRIATLLGKDPKSPLIKRVERVAAAAALGQQTYSVGKEWVEKYKKKVSAPATYTITVRGDDDLYDDVYEWLVQSTDLAEQRTITARSGKRRVSGEDGESHKEPYVGFHYDGEYRFETEIDGHHVVASTEKPGKVKKPKKADSVLDAMPADESDDDSEYVVGYGRSALPERVTFTVDSAVARDAVHRFLNELLVENRKKAKAFEPELMLANRWGNWRYHSRIHIRPLESVVLREGQLDRIVGDLERFLSSEQEYRRRALPWHRGYLFYGPPGTGKTSLAMGLANHFELNMCYIPLGDMDKDANLMDLVQSVPDRCILLFEDVDVFGTATDRKKKNGFTSLSGLLNALDGVGTPHGLVTVMTTNNLDVLDDALVRPGRTDVMEELTLVDERQATRIFGNFYPEVSDRDARRVGRACSGRAPAEILEVCKRNLTTPERAIAELTERVAAVGHNAA